MGGVDRVLWQKTGAIDIGMSEGRFGRGIQGIPIDEAALYNIFQFQLPAYAKILVSSPSFTAIAFLLTTSIKIRNAEDET
jgi:hypothetical protein